MSAESTCRTCADYTTMVRHWQDGTPYTVRACVDPGKWGWTPTLHRSCWHARGTTGEPRQLRLEESIPDVLV